MGTILLFYKYVHIENPEAMRKWQRGLCESLHLTGRIILAHEGINATLGGTDEQIATYVQTMEKHGLFGGIDWKYAQGGAQAFPKLKISVKEEIVRLGVDPNQVTVADTGVHLTPEQVHELIRTKGKDLVILDTRNDYEYAVGKFEGAELPPIKTFREFPAYVDQQLEKYKDKEVLMYCTGGVRCERATAYLVQKEVAKTVYQIEGGIQRYIEKFPNGYFRGKNYVFDARVAIRVNDDILANCTQCQTPCDDYINCTNVLCNKHVIVCSSCSVSLENACSPECHNLILSKQTKARAPFAKL